MSRSQRQSPTTKGRRRGERSLHGTSPPLAESGTILLPRGAASPTSHRLTNVKGPGFLPHDPWVAQDDFLTPLLQPGRKG